MRDVNNSEDVLDSRDVIARRDELKEARDDFNSDHPQPEDKDKDAWEIEFPEDAEELANLEAFIEEGSSSWEDGETLVRESYFEEYAEELASDVSDYDPRTVRWPYTCIDWEQAARELQHDYTGADFDGVTYYYRA